MDYQRLLEEVQTRAALADREAAERAVLATVESLGERLLPLDAAAVASEIPLPLADALRRRLNPGEFGLPELYQRVASREGVPLNFAREHAIAVCLELGRWLDRDANFHLRERLPDDFAELLRPPPSPWELANARIRGRNGRTLAEGRPGSEHPLSEGRADRAQSQSVARSENPHAETKLSSARGVTQEREHQTLAEGHTGSDRPVSEGE